MDFVKLSSLYINNFIFNYFSFFRFDWGLFKYFNIYSSSSESEELPFLVNINIRIINIIITYRLQIIIIIYSLPINIIIYKLLILL